MNKFAARHKLLIPLVGVLFGIQLVYWPAVFWATFEVPISLDPPGKAEANLLVVVQDEYRLYLVLDRHVEADEYLKATMPSIYPSAKPLHVPIQWAVRTPGKPPAYEGITDLPIGDTFTGASNGIALHKAILRGGLYKFTANALEPQPALQRFNPRISLAVHPKGHPVTWQRAVFDWVRLTQVFAFPAFIVMLSVLAWQSFSFFVLRRGM